MLGQVDLSNLRARRDAAYREYLRLQQQVERAEMAQGEKWRSMRRDYLESSRIAQSPVMAQGFFLGQQKPTTEDAMRELTRMKE